MKMTYMKDSDKIKLRESRKLQKKPKTYTTPPQQVLEHLVKFGNTVTTINPDDLMATGLFDLYNVEFTRGKDLLDYPYWIIEIKE